MTNFDDVGDFHEKFGLDSATHRGVGPREVPDDLVAFRAKFMLEEFIEYCEAAGIILVPEYDPIDHYLVGLQPTRQLNVETDHAKAFDALIDLVYVALGTAQLEGYPWEKGWKRVQEANMAKERATSETASERGGTWDVVKPEGWEPPDITEVLRFGGWNV